MLSNLQHIKSDNSKVNVFQTKSGFIFLTYYHQSLFFKGKVTLFVMVENWPVFVAKCKKPLIELLGNEESMVKNINVCYIERNL